VAWRTPLPDSIRDTLVDSVTVDGPVAYLTLRATPQRRAALDKDVVAISLG